VAAKKQEPAGGIPEPGGFPIRQAPLAAHLAGDVALRCIALRPVSLSAAHRVVNLSNLDSEQTAVILSRRNQYAVHSPDDQTRVLNSEELAN
jgi:hypothetical protein